MFKKIKNSTNMSCILLLVAVIIFCSIYASNNKLYVEEMTDINSNELKDNIYHSEAIHLPPPPLAWKGTPEGLQCKITSQTPNSSASVDSLESCKSTFKKYYPKNVKSGIMNYFDLLESEKGKNYHNCSVSDISNCELVTSYWTSPTLKRKVVSRGYTLPNTIVKEPPPPPPPPVVYPVCKPYQGTVWAFCGDKPTQRWGIGPEGEEKALGNCNNAARNEKRWGACK
jgi:hypothetical protein